MLGTNFLDRYRIDSPLGQGGMGAVYRAYDPVLDRQVAIKVLSQADLGSAGRARLLREAQSAARLNHPNIVSIYDAGERDKVPYIIMELVEGHTLHQQRPERIDAILDIARQICSALAHAHSHAIVHRDLKPENVLLTPSGQVKLTDFGLARSVASRLTAEGSIVGSVYYLAPELALGQDFDGRTDLYALGVMLYEFTTGELPFTAGDPLAIISQHLHAPVVPPRARNHQIPPVLEALILQLLNKRIEDRPASAAAVLAAIERILSGETGPAAAAEPTLLDRIVRGRLVGRGAELAQAIDLWNKARAGDSKVLLISGEPGIGKTRLSCELSAQAVVSGAYVLNGYCYAEGNPPYGPVAQMLETAVGLLPPEELANLPGLATVARAVAPAVAAGLLGRLPSPPPVELRAPGPPAPEPPAPEPQAEQQRLFESLVELAAGLSRRAPVLVVLEDAHWADSGTLALLRHLARRAVHLRLRLLFLITYREVELDEARSLDQVLYDFNRERLSVRIKLGRLDREQTHKLLVAILDEDVTPEFLDGIYRETEGNPFFIEEVCKALIEQGELYHQEGRWRWPDMAEIKLPQSIRVAIQARIACLPLAAQETLRIAAIFGREFDLATLQRVSDYSEDVLLEALENAEKAQLITAPPRGAAARRGPSASRPRFAFSHALVASALRESMSGIRRQRLHLRAAQAIEAAFPDRRDELAGQLGEHFAAAGEWTKAAAYLLAAADLARRVFLYPEAITSYEHALMILKEQGDLEAAARTLMKVGLLYHATLDFQRSRLAYQEGFALWKQAGERPPARLDPAPHPLRMYWKGPLTLDPSLAYEVSSVAVINQLFAGLVSLTSDLDVAPELAQSWEVLDGGRKYIFHLRTDAVWSDGTPLTAADFEFSWKRTLHPDSVSRNCVLFFDICGARAFHNRELSDPDQVGVRALNDYTLQVELERPTSFFLHLLTYSATCPVPRHLVAAHPTGWTDPQRIVTYGPFALHSLVRDDRIILVRNPRYTGVFSGNLERVELLQSPELSRFAQRLAAYEAGELDMCELGSVPAEAEAARQRHAGEYVSLPLAFVSFLVFLLDPPFDDPRVRTAFSHAVDRETLYEKFLLGYSQPASGGLIPPNFPGHCPDIGLPYAPDQARRLLAEAGFPGGQGLPEVEVWYPQSEFTRWTDFIRDQWRTVLGVESRWVTMELEEFFRRLTSGDRLPQLFFNGWLADYPAPDNFLYQCILYQTRWRHPEYLQMIATARQMANRSEQMKLYREAQRLMIAEAPLIPTGYGRKHMLLQPWVRHYPLSPIQSMVFKGVILDPHSPA